tara:strand:+ start:1076 stop:1534 length:459 start_codon:yes stop_codon:yes gene_type:complete
MDMKALCDQVRQTAYEVHAYHGHGHLEKPYENALAHRLRKAGMHVEQQYPITIYDEDGTVIGEYVVDLLVENELIVELKTAKNIAPEHTAQLMGYLKSAHKKHGLLINFGAYRFQIKKYLWDPEYNEGNFRGPGITSAFAIGLALLEAMFHR